MNKKPLLNRQDQEKQLSEMWDEINRLTDEDAHRQDKVQQAMETQHQVYQQLATQSKVLHAAWNFCQIINPENPLAAALLIDANAERLKSILKSYQNTTATS